MEVDKSVRRSERKIGFKFKFEGRPTIFWAISTPLKGVREKKMSVTVLETATF